MELINSSNTISSKIPKIIETDKHFIMNTQVYDKQTLKPIPMKFFAFNPSVNMHNSSILSSSVMDGNSEFNQLQNNCHRIGNYKNIIKDKYNANVFYLTSRYYQNHFMCRIIEDNNNYTIDKIVDTSSFGLYSNSYSDFIVLYETDNDFIVWSKSASYYNTFTDYLGDVILKINKKSLSVVRILEENTANNTYYMEHHGNTGYILRMAHVAGFRIYKIDSTTNQYTVINAYIPTANGYNNIGSNPINIDGYYYFLLMKYDKTTGYKYAFAKLKLDTTNDTMSYDIIEINNYDDYKINSSTGNTSLGFNINVRHQIQIFKQNENVYISCTIYGTEVLRTEFFQHKQVLFKLKDNIIEIKQIIPLTDGCKGVLFVDEDYKKPVFVMTNSYLFYSFDSTKEKFINTFGKSGIYKIVGFDSMGRFITQTTDNAIEMLTETNACILKADFNEELYDKNSNNELQTEISFYAKNFLDEYIETNVKLTLIGSVVFQENNSKELITTTSKNGIITKPVIINGYGSIEVIITQST